MLLKNQPQVLVFNLDSNGTFDSIGEINRFTNLIWPDAFNGFAQFELWAPITSENMELLKKGNIIWCGGDNAAIIEIIKSTFDNNGSKIYNVKGRTLEAFLSTRIVWGTYVAENKRASTIMYDLVKQNCINPSDSKRKIPFLEVAPDESFGSIQSYQKTGGEVYEALFKLAQETDLGFSVVFKPREKKMIFKVLKGVDRTIEQSAVEPVFFSTDFEDILSSAYYLNAQDAKSVALVMGEGEGADRVRQLAGESNSAFFDRRELFVDARDLQSKTADSDGNEVDIPFVEYVGMLVQRGNEKLAANATVETFEAKVRVFGTIQYTANVDYFKGDKVTIQDKELGVQVSASITEVEEIFGEEYSLSLTFGYAYPTLLQKLKQ